MAKERSVKSLSFNIREYFISRPLALSIIHLVSGIKDGLTATELADQLHLSVPTLFRYTHEMEQVGLLKSEKHGRKNVFKISNNSVKEMLPETYGYVKNILETESKKKQQRTFESTSILKDYNIPMNPRVAQSMVVSALKRKISENLPVGVRSRNVRVFTILGEPIKFDFVVGTDNKVVAIELKIVETMRNLRERVGTLAMIGKDNPLVGVIEAYMISPIGGKVIVQDSVVENAINSLNKGFVKIVPVIANITPYQILDNNFLEEFSKRIVRKIKELI
jgi:predicted transcriptional regulator